MYDPASRNLLFEVTCWRNRINLEVYHSLTDGTGALQFLKTLVCNYLSIKYPQLSEELMAGIQYDASVSERDEDSFLKYTTRTRRLSRPKTTVPASSKACGCRRAD